MYIVYECNYGELLFDCIHTNIIGLYDDKKKAINEVNKMIKSELESNNNFVRDIETDNIETDNLVRFFYNYQENWNCYYEIIIEKKEVE